MNNELETLEYLKNNKDEVVIVLDIETDGLLCCDEALDNILAVSAVKVKDGKIGERFFSYVAQDKPIPEHIVELTGITDNTVKDAPQVKDVLCKLYDFIGDDDRFVCSHNVRFDMDFIKRHGKGIVGFYNPTIDTLPLSKELLKNKVKNFKLNTCCEFFNIPLYLDDTTKTACLFIELQKLYSSEVAHEDTVGTGDQD